MTSIRRSMLVASAGVALLLVAGTAAAQDPEPVADTVRPPLPPFRLEGTVRDTFDRPLRGAHVRAGARFAITDSLGRFEIDSIAEDPVFIIVRRIGFQPAETEIERQPNVLTIRIGVRLEPSAVQLGTVVVNEQRLSTMLLKDGFYDRMKLASGHFLDEEKLRGRGHTYTAVLSGIPGLDFRFGSFGAVIPLGPASGGMSSSKCALNVYLDGFYIPWASEVGLNNLVTPSELLAVEVYLRPSQVPPRFQRAGRLGGAGSLCGAIVLWTKPFEP